MARKQVPALALAFKGRWRIVAMDLWDKDAIDLVEPGFITFNGECKRRRQNPSRMKWPDWPVASE